MTYGLWGAWVFGLLQRRWMDGNPYNKICGLAPYHAVIKWYHNGRTAFRDIVVRGDPAVGATMSKPNTESDDQPAKVADFTSYENIELSMERFDAKGTCSAFKRHALLAVKLHPYFVTVYCRTIST
jgi:hypothetical protein